MLASVQSCTLIGIDALAVDVEVDVALGLPGYHVVGLPAVAIKEGAVRIRSALEQVGHDLPNKRVTVNLAPADTRKVGTAFDLPIALGVLVAEGFYAPELLDDIVVMGELGLDGALRPVRGVLAAAALARQLGVRRLLVPAANGDEACLVKGIEVLAAAHLGDVLAMFEDERDLGYVAPDRPPRPRPPLDMSEVRGQSIAREALEVAVAGGHNLLMSGPPGIGKTMLARRIPGLLPPMTHEEALETTKVYSSLGLVSGGLIDERPFRAPHHTISTNALLGGGSGPRPGEVSLAHNGVLFLDELPEFARATIEALRQPLEDRYVTIGRVHRTLRFPASFMLVASANPCPCGFSGTGVRECTCSNRAIERYRSRLSGPLLDRIDLLVTVKAVKLGELRDTEPAESSASIRARVIDARERQRNRLARWGLGCNAEMTPAIMRACCRLDAAGEKMLAELHASRRGMSARAVDRLIKVARTLADLDGDVAIAADHILRASTYRRADGDDYAGADSGRIGDDPGLVGIPEPVAPRDVREDLRVVGEVQV